MAATYYVHGTTGSDSNTGLTTSDPFKTLAAWEAIAASGDTVNVAAPIWDDGAVPTGAATPPGCAITISGKSNITIQQWDGQTQGDLRNEVQLVQSGWTASTNAWQKTIAAGLTISDVGGGWDTLIDSDGRHYGHFQSDTLANVQNATGATGKYNYTSPVLTVYAGGNNPNTWGKPIHYCVGNAPKGIAFTGGTGCIVRGLTCSLYTGSGQAYGVWFNGHQNGSILGCTFLDGGLHNTGFLSQGAVAANVGNAIIGCTFKGLAVNGTHSVHYTDAACGDTTLASVTDCTFWMYRHLGLDGNTITGLAGNTQIGPYAHADTGTPIADWLVSGCTVRQFEAAYTPVGVDNAPAPSDVWDWDDYAARVDRLTLVNGSRIRPSYSIAFRRCRLEMYDSGPSGQGDYQGLGAVCVGNNFVAAKGLFESCEFQVDSTNVSVIWAGFKVNVSGQELCLLNCSCYDRSTSGAGRLWLSWGDANNRHIRARGCVFMWSVAPGTSGLCYLDGTTDAAHHDILDCAYYNMASYSGNAALGSEANWNALVDTSALFLVASPYPTPSVSLALNVTSNLWTPRRATSTIVPTAGINSAYIGNFGAFQYPPIGTHHISNGIGIRI